MKKKALTKKQTKRRNEYNLLSNKIKLKTNKINKTKARTKH